MKYYGSAFTIYAVDENGNMFLHHKYGQGGNEDVIWENVEPIPALAVLVQLGKNTFPRGKSKGFFEKVPSFLSLPFRALSLVFRKLENRGNFILGTLVVVLMLSMIGLATATLIANMYKPAPDKTATPTSIIMQYNDGTSLSYPIKMEIPKPVEIIR